MTKSMTSLALSTSVMLWYMDYGKTKQDHDKALDAICQRFTDIGLALNEKKCFFNQTKLTFFGMVFSSEGISPDPAKVSAIKNISTPQNAKDVRSFLGMATCYSKFIPKFSDLSEPLRKLTTKNAHIQVDATRTNSI